MSKAEKVAIAQANLFKVILRPHISEKTTRIAESHRHYAFEIAENADKGDVKRAVEFLFNVNVEKVHVLHVRPKKKIFKQVRGQRKGWKKAYVKLQEGQQIDFAGRE